MSVALGWVRVVRTSTVRRSQAFVGIWFAERSRRPDVRNVYASGSVRLVCLRYLPGPQPAYPGQPRRIGICVVGRTIERERSGVDAVLQFMKCRDPRYDRVS